MSQNDHLVLDIPQPNLHDAQKVVYDSQRRFNVLACGRRWGKTLFTSFRIASHEAAMHKQRWGWFAPTYKILNDAWYQTKYHMRTGIETVNESDRIIRFQNGGSIEFWSMVDDDAGRSRKYHGVVIDEAGLVADLESRWHESIRPTLVDYRGKAWLCGTPKGRNFFWQAFTYGQDPLKTDWASWQMPTSSNPFIAADELEAARQMPDRSFRQEFLAEFIDEAGGVFRGVLEVIDRDVVSRSVIGQHIYIGVDLARVNDFTVICVVDATGRQIYHERFNQISWERQIDRIKTTAHRFPTAQIWLDSTGVGDPIFEALRSHGLNVFGYHFTHPAKAALIDSLAMLIEQGRIRLLDISEQTSELLAYQYMTTRYMNIRMGAPLGIHDDCVIALALACWPLKAGVQFGASNEVYEGFWRRD
jgi:hypothetical protein